MCIQGPSFQRFLRIGASVALTMGVVLLVINLVGYFHYTVIDADTPNVLDENPRTISEAEFWAKAYRANGEDMEEYVARLSWLVSERMLLIDSAHVKPTVFENWIVWLYAQKLGHYEWIDTKRAVRLGGGFCSQHAIIFNNILREQGFEARILGVNGHVLNEVLIDGTWRVYDPDYNVVFTESLSDLERDPNRARDVYLENGRPEDEAIHWSEVFGSASDNWHFRSARMYNVANYLVEKAAFKLVWLIPLVLLLIGALGLWFVKPSKIAVAPNFANQSPVSSANENK